MVIPQLARTSGWNPRLLVLTIRSYIFLLVNLLAQGLVLFFIFKEELIWDVFAGQMYLCDTGTLIQSCPAGMNCIGPGGTVFTPPRMYSWKQWGPRNFAHDSIKALFPEHADRLDTLMDPGEYGVESYRCRLCCCFLFMITVMGDLENCFELGRVLWIVPTKAESWVSYDVPQWADKRKIKEVHDWNEFDLVRIRVSGMPWHWKLINIVFVLLPKFLIWKITCEAGITFLMETTAIEDVIVNATALIFILNIDEMLCQELMSADVRTLLEKVEPPVADHQQEDDMDELTDDQVLEMASKPTANGIFRFMFDLMPMKIIIVTFLTCLFIRGYYNRNCVKNEQGGWVSHPMYLPTSTSLTFAQAFFPNIFKVDSVEEPFWEQPTV